MKLARVLALSLILVLDMLASGSRLGAAGQPPPDQAVTDISPEALAQIDALIAEKDSRTPVQQKIDSQLIYQRKMEAGEPVADGIWVVETDLPYADDGHLVVDVRARAGSGLVSRLSAAGIEVVFASDDGSDVRAHMNVDQVEALAADPDVLFIQPRQGAIISGQEAVPNLNLLVPTGQGSRSSEGDVTHLAFAARGAFHVDGTGVKIGVLSNGVTNLAASQALGDLGPVTVLQGQAGSGDEGTAMLEIIHDLAPGAQLYFATAFGGISLFAQNIRALRAAGCDIIVDDVFYFVETPFQNGQALLPGVVSNTNGGVVIQAVKDVTASGALYFSSAGNAGNLDAGTAGVWEGDFVDGGATGVPLPAGGRVHNFGGQNFNFLTLANANAPISLYWSDPLGGSSNDYDLFRLNAAGTLIVAASTNIQNGTRDPFEQISQSTTNPRIVVVKKSSAQPRFLHLNTIGGRLSIPTSGTTHGHATVTGDGAYGVAATPAGAAFPQPFNAGNLVETFSSDGPRHIFYQADGTAITPGNVSSTGGQVLQKPDITAADGVSVTGVGGFPSTFFGTSAAAPHAAAIAALVKSANLTLTPAQIRTILTSTAIDIQAAGVDRDSGAGIIMARDAVGATGAVGTAFLQVDQVQVSDNPGNGNGLPEAGEGARMTLTLKNYGVAPATGISGSLTSPTRGITVGLPNSVTYPSLAPNASAANGTPLLFTAASDFGCPGSAGFTFTVSYTGGSGPPQSFSVPIGGVRSYSITRALDGTVPPPSPGVTTTAGQQAGRLFRDGVVSMCGVQKFSSGFADFALRHFESYQFNTCPASSASCATVTLQGPNAISLFTAAYAPTFNTSNILQNYKADPGTSAASRTYSFGVGGGAQSFAIDVHDVPVTNPPSPNPAPSGNVYTLTVSGICTGACDPPNHPPIARAKNVTAAANPLCVADASIDNGSSDADGDPFTLVQAPPSPYPLGATSVLLTATDPKGAFSQASGSVTVLDQTPPSIACPAPITQNTAPGLCSAAVTFAPPTASDLCSNPTAVSTDPVSGSAFPLGTTTVAGSATDAAGNKASCTTTVTVVDREPPVVSGLSLSATSLWPPDHEMVDVTVSYATSDNCSAASCVLTVSSNESVNGSGDGNTSPDWQVIDAHHVQLRAERSGDGTGRVYTLTLTCTDAAGNRTVRTATVLVPHNQ